MKTLQFLIPSLLLLYNVSLFGQDINSNYSDWPFEITHAIKLRSAQIIDRIFPKIQDVEHWTWDKYNYNSIEIDNISDDGVLNNEKHLIINGSFGFYRSGGFFGLGEGTHRLNFKALGRFTANGSLYIKQLCYFEDESKCHDPAIWGLETID